MIFLEKQTLLFQAIESNVIFNIKLNEVPPLELCPRLYLLCPRVRIGFQEEKVYGLKGCIPFLDFDGDTDLIGFNDSDLILMECNFTVPYSRLVPFTYTSSSQGTMYLNHNFCDSCNMTKYSGYNITTDELILSYVEWSVISCASATKVAKDFYVLYDSINNVIGWKVNNSSQYICDDEGNYFPIEEKDRFLLAQFWEIHTQKTFDDVYQKDEGTLAKLDALRNKVEHIHPILEALEVWSS